MNVNPFHGRYFLLVFCLFQFLNQTEGISRTCRVGAREAGLSDAVISLPGIWSVFYNPAGMVYANRLQAGVYHESVFLLKELSLAAGTVVIPAGNGNMGLGLLQSGNGPFRENKFIAAYGTRISRTVSAGLQLFGIAGPIPENARYTGWVTFGTGCMFLPAAGLTLGASLFNPVAAGPGRMFQAFSDPFCFRMGGHYYLGHDVLISFEAEQQKDYPLKAKSGIEFIPARNVSFRCGMSGQPVSFSFGAGYVYGNVTMDIAFRYHEYLGITPSVSLQFVP